MADGGDATGGVRWETYPAGARLLGMKVESFRRLAIRKGWRRTPGNDGLARVAVPVEAIELRRDRHPRGEATLPGGDAAPGAVGGTTGVAPTFRGTDLVAVLYRRAEAAEARADAEAEARREAETLARAQASQIAELRQELGRFQREAQLLGERMIQVEAERDTALARTTQAEQERAEARGEVDGLKLGLEHMQSVLAQARREAAETGAKAEQAARAAKDANERVARLYSRGLWARVRNRP